MIRNVNKFYCDERIFPKLPPSVFNIINVETNTLVEPDAVKGAKYYLFHNGQDTDIYKRVIDLNFVDVCETDLEDDLSVYGFKLIGKYQYGLTILKRWIRK